VTLQERDLILEVAQRLRNTRLPEKDLEADRLIRAEVGSQPDSLYLLTQTVIVQEQGLRHAQERIRQLESGAAGPSRGSFLGGAGTAPAALPAALPATPAGPPPPPPAGGGSAVGSFLGTAAAAAAGAVGGQLIYEGMRHMFGGHGAWGAPPAAGPAFPREGGRTSPEESWPSTPARRDRAPDRPEDDAGPAGGDFEDAGAGAGGDFGEEDAGAGGDFGEEDVGGGDFDDEDADADGDFGDTEPEDDPDGGSF
jgi:uncharacterized protein